MRGELFILALREAQKHKHFQQTAVKKDLGDGPIFEWFKKHWQCWYRERWIEHLSGKKCWNEFGEADFNLAQEKIFDPELVVRIIGNLKKHRDNISENLGMVLWASKEGRDMGQVLKILRRIDINSKRPDCDIDKLKIYFLALEEADRHKYIQSQKAKKDLGEASISEWFAKHWPGFAKANGLSSDMIDF